MKTIMSRALLLCVSAMAFSSSIAELTKAELELVGIWEAKKAASSQVQGSVLLEKSDTGWRVDVAGYKLPVAQNGDKLTFDIPGDRGSFRGKLNATDHTIRGHWVQPETLNNGMPYASPIVLKPIVLKPIDLKPIDSISISLGALGKHTATEKLEVEKAPPIKQWRGEIAPMVDEFSLFLPVSQRDDRTLGAFLRNPERGFGAYLNVDHLKLNQNSVDWIGQNFRNKEQLQLIQAPYQTGRMSATIRGTLYEMRLAENSRNSHFYARGKYPSPYNYTPPPKINSDGWPTSTFKEAGMDKKPIADLIDNVILKTADSINDPYIHGFLIARSGKLVLEEYFHGYHRDKPHDTRSASKSLASVLVGAAIQAGLPLAEETPVMQTILNRNEHETASKDQLKNKIRLHHLLSMSSGLDCDDGNSSSPGNEDVMQSQDKQMNWYRYTMDLAMVRGPGEKAVYCSGGMNLVGAVLSRSTGKTIEELLFELIAVPLQIKHYYLNIAPNGQPYLGGGIYWKPRDFMKLGQLILNGGTWNGHRILSQAFSKKSISAIHPMRNKEYGYAWWTTKYPYQEKTVTAFFAAGNGGQIVMGIPELDLLIAFYAGNYSHKTAFRIQQEFIPKYILPSVLPPLQQRQ